MSIIMIIMILFITTYLNKKNLGVFHLSPGVVLDLGLHYHCVAPHEAFAMHVQHAGDGA